MLCLPLALFLLVTPEAPVSEVTVYSDRARVTRVAHVTPGEPTDLPLLPEGIDASSVRVEATGAEVRKVELSLVGAEEVPVDEAKGLLNALEQKGDALGKLNAQRSVLRAEVDALRRLRPEIPRDEPLRPAARLDPSGWDAATRFIDAEQEKRLEKIRALDETVRTGSRELAQLAEKARLLGATRRGGWRVRVTLAGSGPASVRVTYLIAPARWLPNYDVQLVPETGKVHLAFSGLVSQETGEDWSDAQLTLSTAVPGTATQLPRLATWKIGQKDRFIPTPAPVTESIRAAPPAAPPLPVADPAEQLRQRLLSVANAVPAAASEVDALVAQGATMPMPMAPPEMEPSAAMAPPPPPPMPTRSRRPSPKNYPSQHVSQPAPPSMAPAMDEEMEYKAAEGLAVARPGPVGGRVREISTGESPGPAGSLSPPAAYVAPVYSEELPAAAAGGYDLSYRSLRPETIQSGHGQRRVALFAESWPVTVERRVFPALAHEAFLVAQLQSPASQLLPSGPATLFVGADPAGTAQFKRVAPKEQFTLPLGLDRAIKPVRNVQLLEAEKGFIVGKEELNTYVVTDELANPYPVPIQVRIYDQYPLTDDKDVEVKLLGTEPWALEDKVKGSLEWDLTVKPGQKAVVSFRYSLRRPKGWRLHQSQ